MTNSEKIAKWESLWATYVAKLARLDDLRAQGRYGYQLKMPKRALHIAAQAIRDFDRVHGEYVLTYQSGPERTGAVAWEGR